MEILHLPIDPDPVHEERLIYAILVRDDVGKVLLHKGGDDGKRLEVFDAVDEAKEFLEKHPAPEGHDVALQECLMRPCDGGFEILFQNSVITVAHIH